MYAKECCEECRGSLLARRCGILMLPTASALCNQSGHSTGRSLVTGINILLLDTCGDLFNSITNPEGAVDSSFLFPLPFQIFIPIDRFSARTERTSYPYKERGKTICMESRTHPWNASRACTDAMLP